MPERQPPLWPLFDVVIFDCDSTLSTIEGIDELARMTGHEHDVAVLTKRAMEGDIPLEAVYGHRLITVNPTQEQVQRVLDLLQRRFHYVVLDLPHDFSATTLAGLDMAADILLVLPPELGAVRATVAALEAFQTLQYAEEHIHLVQNWVFKRPGLPRKEIESLFQRPVRWVLPYMADAVVHAINHGRPLALGDPNSPVRALFEDWAFLLSKPEHRLHKPSQPTETWRRVVKRFQKRKAARK